MSATRLDRWSCPLCSWSVASTDINADTAEHGVSEHPASFPARMTTGQQLAWIIAMAAEARQTVNHPNPTDRAMPHKHARIDSAGVPADLASISTLGPGEGLSVAYSAPAATLVRCSRICWDAMDADMRAEHPQTLGAVPTIESEAHWLADAWPDALAVLDAADIDWIESDVRSVCSELAQLTRTRRMPTIPCVEVGCQGVVPAVCEDTDGYLWADVCTNNHRVDRHAIARAYRESQPMSLSEISEIVGVPRRTLSDYSKPTTTRPALFRPTGKTRWKAELYLLADVRRALEFVHERKAC